jgi:hypothetical protein
VNRLAEEEITRAVLHALGSPAPRGSYWLGNATLQLTIPAEVLTGRGAWLRAPLQTVRFYLHRLASAVRAPTAATVSPVSSSDEDREDLCDGSQEAAAAAAAADGFKEGSEWGNDDEGGLPVLSFTLPLKRVHQLFRLLPAVVLQVVSKFFR